ncbi:MAG: crossover junction endodeoxyribonuclease RuvC, partial [Elusimicrobia bacterium]|nr:crossover junction endodeoxyribonuclease RuvC [Elusimicrobiota bacterium]
MSAPVLGVDPGVSETGWAVLETADGAPRLMASGLIKTYPETEFPERLDFLHRSLSALISE